MTTTQQDSRLSRPSVDDSSMAVMSPPAPSIRILLIEDSPIDARLITAYLKQGLHAAYQVLHVTDLTSAVEALKHRAVEIIILDLSLPDCSGFATFSSVHATAPDVPIVVLTGLEDEDIAMKTIQEGAQDYLLKSALTAAGIGRTIRYGIERRRLQDDLRKRDRELLIAHKFESLGQLAAGIGHEINTPLQFVGDSIAFIGDQIAPLKHLLTGYDAVVEAHRLEYPDAVVIATVEALVKQADLAYLCIECPLALKQAADGLAYIKSIVIALKRIAHPDGAEPTAGDINQLITDAMVMSRGIIKRVARIEFAPDPRLAPIRCHPASLVQVFINLLTNAAHAIESAPRSSEPGVITVTTRIVDAILEIRIHDNGPGISETISERIFEPFFTTKAMGEGSGQGLAIARAIVVKDHGGKLEFESDRTGTAFIVKLPI